MSDSSNRASDSTSIILRNILWIVFAGSWYSVLWLIPTIILVFSVIGIPYAMQTYKIAKYVFLPFDHEKSFVVENRYFTTEDIVWSILFGWFLLLISPIQLLKEHKHNFYILVLKPFKFDKNPYALTLRKRDLIVYYLGAYIFIAYLETIWFTILIGSWTFRDILLNFSMWGITWLVSLFAYPMFFTDANQARIALNPYFSLFGYVIIIAVFYLTFVIHKRSVEAHINKKISFTKLVDLYFPVKKEKSEAPSKKESSDVNQTSK